MRGKSILLLLLCFISVTYVYSQQVKQDEVIVVDGKKYIVHQVRTGETLFSIAKKYKTETDEIQMLNPGIEKGIQIGQEIRIPYQGTVLVDKPQQEKKTIQPDSFEYHTIKSKSETPYYISKVYNVSVEDIFRYNPGVTKFKKGTQIRIPRWNQKAEEPVKKETVAEKKSENPVPVAEPEKKTVIVEHIIGSGETKYGVCRKYDITEEELVKLNPELADKFPAGMIIKIPVAKLPSSQAKPVNNNAFRKYVVGKGETLYGLAEQNNMEVSDIIRYNPQLEERGLIEGETILIPLKPEASENRYIQGDKDDSVRFFNDFYKIETTDVAPKGCDKNGWDKNKSCEIALLLPFFITDNEASLKLNDSNDLSQDKGKSSVFYGETENYLQFYEGFILAANQWQERGYKIKLNVFDTRGSEGAVTTILRSNGFEKNSLIIGPVQNELQKEVSEYSEKNGIPLISPLASGSAVANTNPWFFQINPDKEYLAEITAEWVVLNYFKGNILILTSGDSKNQNEKRITEMIQEKMANFCYTNKLPVKKPVLADVGSSWQNLLVKGKTNVVFVESTNEGVFSSTVQKLSSLAGDFPITLLASNHRYIQQFPSIKTEYFHQLKLEYVAPYWIEYNNPNTQKMIEKFRLEYGTEPNNYGYQGYDIANYFISAVAGYGKDFRDCLPYLKTNLTQGNYAFVKNTSSGGYKNKGVSVVAMTPDFDLVRKKVIGLKELK